MIGAAHEITALKGSIALVTLQGVDQGPEPPVKVPGCKSFLHLKVVDVGVDVPGGADLMLVDHLAHVIN